MRLHEPGGRDEASTGGATYTTEPIVLVVVLRLLDHVSSHDCCISVVVVLLVGDKVDFAQELLLMILEFTDHLGLIFLVRRLFS